jgi:hypothetical protein
MTAAPLGVKQKVLLLLTFYLFFKVLNLGVEALAGLWKRELKAFSNGLGLYRCPTSKISTLTQKNWSLGWHCLVHYTIFALASIYFFLSLLIIFLKVWLIKLYRLMAPYSAISTLVFCIIIVVANLAITNHTVLISLLWLLLTPLVQKWWCRDLFDYSAK